MNSQVLRRLLFGMLLAAPLASRADYIGARGIIDTINNLEAQDQSAVEKSEADAVKADITAFRDEAARLEPGAAAQQWLGLYDRFDALPSGDVQAYYSDGSDDQLSFGLLIAALPGPDAWPSLHRLVASREPAEGRKALREGSLKLLVASLVGARDEQYTVIAAMLKEAQSLDKYQRQESVNAIQQVLQALHAISGNKKGIVESFEAAVKKQADSDYPSPIDVPDLVTLVGSRQAKALLRKALVAKGVTLRVPVGDETLKLAQAQALQLVDQLAESQWHLVVTLDATALYEAMEKRFVTDRDGETDADDMNDGAAFMRMMEGQAIPAEVLEQLDFDNMPDDVRGAMRGAMAEEATVAKIYYFLGLVTAGEIDKAYGAALSLGKHAESIELPERALQDLAKAGYVGKVHQLFKRLLTENPELPYWEQLIALGAQIGDSAGTLSFLRDAMARDDIGELARLRLTYHLVDARLANDDLESGVALLQELLATDTRAASEDVISFQKSKRRHSALRLAHLGHYLGRTDWLETGLTLAAPDPQQQRYGSSGGFVSTKGEPLSYVGLLTEIGRGDEAEQVILKQMKHMLTEAKKNEWGMAQFELTQPLSQLVELYYRVGRTNDIVTLWNDSPYWRADDLANLDHYRSGGASFHTIVADILGGLGRNQEAIDLIKQVLYENGSLDDAYALLVDQVGSQSLPFLDELYALDRFEERPLIWKAHVLRLDGKLDEAQRAAEAAIAIDPSDGEQGRGKRMRVYSEMAAIMAARGNAEKAAFFDGVVKAIRLSEDADRLYNVGLLKRGIAMYLEALNYFADAYCIQSRLALQLEEAGEFNDAEDHYRQAYELMPDSFGRVESHCFGCEGVFNSERSQGMADRIFSRLVVETPDKPQVHYLLGYLRSTQERYAEAADLFRRATELDGEYLNAWKKLAETGAQLQLPPADLDALALVQLKLDPLGRHSYPDLGQVSDLTALWRAVEAAKVDLPKPAESIYVLTASKARLDEEKKTNPFRNRRYAYGGGEARDRQPGQVLASHNFIGEIMQLWQTGQSVESHRFID